MATLFVRAEKTASNRAKLLGQLDRHGAGAEALQETDDELIAVIPGFAGDEAAAREAFEGAQVEYNESSGKVKKAGESEDFEPFVEIDGEVIARPAASREGPPAPPEYDAGPPVNVDDQHAPDTADAPSPGISGAAMGQATRDKQRIAGDQGDAADNGKPASRAKK